MCERKLSYLVALVSAIIFMGDLARSISKVEREPELLVCTAGEPE